MAVEGNIENSQLTTSEELSQLKKETFGKIIDEKKKDDPALYISKNSVIDYLMDEEENKINVGKFFKGLFGKAFCNSRDELVDISKDIKKCNTQTELNNLETLILNGESMPQSDRTDTTTQSPTQTPEYSDNSEHYEIDHFNIEVSQKYRDIYNQLKGPEKPDLAPFACAMKGYEELRSSLGNPKYLTVVDFTKPRSENRLYVINMDTKTVEHATRVGHGHNSGEGEWATSFSNTNGSEQSNLGFLTTSTQKEDNYSHTRRGLRMHGTDKDNQNNGNAANRGIFMHKGGDNLYSQGCFVLPEDVSETILNKVIGGSLLFAYAKSRDYFAQSNYFNTDSNGDVQVC